MHNVVYLGYHLPTHSRVFYLYLIVGFSATSVTDPRIVMALGILKGARLEQDSARPSTIRKRSYDRTKLGLRHPGYTPSRRSSSCSARVHWCEKWSPEYACTAIAL